MNILAEVYRGTSLESVHTGHLFIEDGSGREIFSVGDPNFTTFIRSAGKPFQAIPFIVNGGVERFGFTEQEIALSCASHAGESIHVETAASMLAKLGLTEAHLKCGTHIPFDERTSSDMLRNGEKPSQLHNNCSGKHSCMLGQALLGGYELEGYLAFDHPIQKEIAHVISQFTDIPVEQIETAVDGCSAPNHVLTMRGMARGYARLVNPPDTFSEEMKSACDTIASAMSSNPHLVSGTDRLDTIVMDAASTMLVISKIGAEGIWLCGIAPNERWPHGLGIALKISDGDDRRARPVVAIEVLKALGAIPSEALEEYSPIGIKSRVGDRVGEVRSVIDFRF
jgi:L-asparaginase II